MERIPSGKGAGRFEHLLYFPSGESEKASLVLLFHEYVGMDEALHIKARALAEEGFLVGMVDLYGVECRDLSPEKARELLKPLRKNRLLLRERALEASEALGAATRRKPKETFLLGFSLGGGGVLEMVRYQPWAGAVSVYGYLDSPVRESEGSRETPLLVIHGMKDRVVPPEDLLLFLEELEQREWHAEVLLYSGVGHGFCNPSGTADFSRGNFYHPEYHAKAWKRILEFFESLEDLRKGG
jgi:dienelactone hydrolase